MLTEIPLTASSVSILSPPIWEDSSPSKAGASSFGPPQALPLEIPVKEVIKEGNPLCLGPHQRGFVVNPLFPLPLL